MVNYWLALTNDINWKLIKINNIYAIKSKKIHNLLYIGDIIIIYLIPKKIAAIYIIKSLISKSIIKFDDEKYKYYIDIEPLYILEKPLEISKRTASGKIPDVLSIFKGKTRWGTVLMGRSLIQITYEDYLYLESLVKKYASI